MNLINFYCFCRSTQNKIFSIIFVHGKHFFIQWTGNFHIFLSLEMWFRVNGEIFLMFEAHFSAVIVIEYIRDWRSMGEVEQTTSQWHNVWQICGSAIKNNFFSSFRLFCSPLSGYSRILCTFLSHIHSSANAKRLNGRYDPGGFKGFPLFSRLSFRFQSERSEATL